MSVAGEILTADERNPALTCHFPTQGDALMRSRTRLAAARRWPSRALLALALPATLAALLLGPAAPAHAAGTVVYVPDTNVNTVSVIDTSTNAITATIPVGNAPTYTAVTPDGSQVFVSNSLGTSVSVISASSDTVTATIPVSGEPQQVVLDRTGAFAYVVSTNGYVTQISTATDTVTGTVDVGDPPTRPGDLARRRHPVRQQLHQLGQRRRHGHPYGQLRHKHRRKPELGHRRQSGRQPGLRGL
jgi:YVTN family beta-propeller protein